MFKDDSAFWLKWQPTPKQKPKARAANPFLAPRPEPDVDDATLNAVLAAKPQRRERLVFVAQDMQEYAGHDHALLTRPLDTTNRYVRFHLINQFMHTKKLPLHALLTRLMDTTNTCMPCRFSFDLNSIQK